MVPIHNQETWVKPLHQELAAHLTPWNSDLP